MANHNDIVERFVSPMTDHFHRARQLQAAPILHHSPNLSPDDRDSGTHELHPAPQYPAPGYDNPLSQVEVFADRIEVTNPNFTAGRDQLHPNYSPDDLPKAPLRRWSGLNTDSLRVINLQNNDHQFAHVLTACACASNGMYAALTLLVSYSTPVAILLRNNGVAINGTQAAVFELWCTPNRYSSTTDRHISHALSAYRRACRVLDVPQFVYMTKAVDMLRSAMNAYPDPTLVLRTHESHYSTPSYLLKLAAERIAAPRLHARTRWDAVINTQRALDPIRRATQELIPGFLINEHFAKEIADTQATLDHWAELIPTLPPEEQDPPHFIHSQTAMRDPAHPNLLQLRAMAAGLLALEHNHQPM